VAAGTNQGFQRVEDTAYASLRGIYRYLNIKPLTAQQELFLLQHLRGMNIAAAARAAGMQPRNAYTLMKDDRIEKIRDYFRETLMKDVAIELSTLNQMALEAHAKAANATEELKAVETLGKLNQVGAYASPAVLKQRAEAESQEKDITPKNAKQLESMDEERLMELAQIDGLDSLTPEPLNQSRGNATTPDLDEFIDEVDLSDALEGEAVVVDDTEAPNE